MMHRYRSRSGLSDVCILVRHARMRYILECLEWGIVLDSPTRRTKMVFRVRPHRTANFTEVFLSVAEKVVTRLTRKPRLPRWFEDIAIRTEFEKAWNEKESVRSKVRPGSSRDEPAWPTFRAACKKVKEAI